MSIFKKYLSYLLPIKLESAIGQDNTPLEVYYDCGKIKLFTKTTNYSGGKLKTMFRKALKDIQFTDHDRVLVLGFGMGSIWEIIKLEKKQYPTIIGVDYEKTIEEFIKTYNPDILSDKKTTLIVDNALNYMVKSNEKYTHILIDLFVDNAVAEVIFKEVFIQQLKKVCDNNTVVIINTMGISDKKMDIYSQFFRHTDVKIIEKTNKVYYLQPLG